MVQQQHLCPHTATAAIAAATAATSARPRASQLQLLPVSSSAQMCLAAELSTHSSRPCLRTSSSSCCRHLLLPFPPLSVSLQCISRSLPVPEQTCATVAAAVTLRACEAPRRLTLLSAPATTRFLCEILHSDACSRGCPVSAAPDSILLPLQGAPVR